MSNILNVLANANGPMVVNVEEFDAAISRGIAEAQAVHAKNDARREDAQWRDELQELTARLTGRKSLAEAEQNLASLRAEVKAAVDETKGKIHNCDKALKEKFLSNSERSELVKTRANLEEAVTSIHANTRVRLAQAEQAVKDAAELDKLRPRLEELRKRAASIDKALQV